MHTRKKRFLSLIVLLPTLVLFFCSGGGDSHAQGGTPITAATAADVTTLAILGRGWINNLSWSPDGSTLVVAGSAGAWLHDTTDWDAPPRLVPGPSDTWAAVYSPDMARLALGGSSAIVWVVDPATGDVTHQFTCQEGTHGGPLTDLDFAPDGTRLACAAASVQVWDLTTRSPEPLVTLAGSAVAYHPDGTMLATGNRGRVLLWDAADFRLLANFHLADEDDEPTDLDFNPGGWMIGAATYRGAYAWLMPAGALELERPHNYPVNYHLAGHTGGYWNHLDFWAEQQLAVGQMAIWDLAASTAVDSAVHPFEAAPYPEYVSTLGVAVAPDGSRLAGAIGTGVIHVWDVASGDRVTTLDAYNVGGSERGGAYSDQISAASVAFSPDGAVVAVGGGGYADTGGPIQLWDAATGARLGAVPDSQAADTLAFSADGRRLLAAHPIHGVHLWDVSAGATEGTLRFAAEYPSVVGCFTPDGSTVAAPGAAGVIELRDATSGDVLAALPGEVALPRSMVCGKDLLAVGTDDGLIHLWDLTTRQVAVTLAVDGQVSVSALAFNPDQSVLAAGTWDGVVLYSLAGLPSGDPPPAYAMIEMSVHALAFSPDGSLLAVGGSQDDRTLGLYDTATGEPLALLAGQTFSVNGLSFNVTGTRLASSSWDGTVRLWGVQE